MKNIKKTPMIEQYLTIKKDYNDALVFFRLGDFYELFFDDAIIASKVLEIALTKRNKNSNVVMCGVPYHSVMPYIQKLIKKGFKVVIVEQVTQPGNGLVERQVTKMITPGQVLDGSILDEGINNYISYIERKENGYILYYIDISTGESTIIENLKREQLFDNILSLNLKEVLLTEKYDTQLINFLNKYNILITYRKKELPLNNKLIKQLPKDLKSGASQLIKYITNSQKNIFLTHLMPFEIERPNIYLKLDYSVYKHLEILESNTNNPKTTLFYYLNKTQTAMGERRLRHFFSHPLKDIDKLNLRYKYIEALISPTLSNQITNELKYCYDINRICARISLNSANAKDLVQLKKTLNCIPNLKKVLNNSNNDILINFSKDLKSFDNLVKLIEDSIIDEPPITLKQGGIIKNGYSKELDELRYIQSHGKEWLLNFQEEERKKTGIKNLKIGFNKIFGYYIEISKGNLDLVLPEYDYIRKQTLVNYERFISPRLKEVEEKMTKSSEKSLDLEYQLFLDIRKKIYNEIIKLQDLATKLSYLDAYLSLAIASREYNYIKPILTKDRTVDIKNARHPVVELQTKYIKNDININPNEIFIMTGPNMGGKSTYMRMIAIIIYMAQIGSFIPADYAKLPIYDAIYTRIGASDDIAGGKSTFMVEMVEANYALRNATKNSLIIFDEIGRGTATYDGMALAQGIIEYIDSNIKAQTLFSTHYHELTFLDEKLKNVTNLCTDAKKENGVMQFLYKIKKGSSSRSYGLEVAKLANLPDTLIKTSKKILTILENNKKNNKKDSIFNYNKVKIDDDYKSNPNIDKVIDDLKNININELTPLDALILIKNYQNKLKDNDD